MNAAASVRAIERHPVIDRESWLALRRENINASEIGIVCGAGGYGSPAELYAEKKGLRPPLIDSGTLKRGRWGEAAVFEALADERPEWDVRRAKVYLRDPVLRIGATPDGFAIAPDRDGFGVVQTKMVSRSVFRAKWLVDPAASIAEGEARPPLAYELQTLTEELLSDCPWGVLAVVINGEYDWDFRLFDVPRHPEAEARILEDVAAFWRDWLDPGVMPPFNPQRDEALVKILYPADDGTEIDLSADNRVAELVDELVEKRAGRRRLEDRDRPDRDRAARQARSAHLWADRRRPPHRLQSHPPQGVQRRRHRLSSRSESARRTRNRRINEQHRS